MLTVEQVLKSLEIDPANRPLAEKLERFSPGTPTNVSAVTQLSGKTSAEIKDNKVVIK